MKKYLGFAAALAGAMLTLVASPVMAHTDVDISIGVPGVVYAQPAPVYVQPAPVYMQPRPVYVQPRPVYVEPQPVYVQPQTVYIERHHRHGWRERPGYGWRDQDRDGVPDRWDRRPYNPYRN